MKVRSNWRNFYDYKSFFFLMLDMSLYNLCLLSFMQSVQFRCSGMFWGKLSLTSPSSAISAAKRCSLLHCSGPAPTRHECQIVSKVNFLLLTLSRSSFQYFLFHVCRYSNCSVALPLICFTVALVPSFEVKWFPQSPVSTAAAALEMSLTEWAWAK